MKYYFNTENRINGDKAFTEEDYELALKHYEKAQFQLSCQFTDRKAILGENFYDAFAYVLCEIIITKCMIIQSARKADDWSTIPALLNEMTESLNAIKYSKSLQTNKIKLDKLYRILSKTCEGISDDLFDEYETAEKGDFKDAIQWMERAIDYRLKTTKPLKLEMHLGYLNLLQTQFKITGEVGYLDTIDAYFKTHNLLDLKDYKSTENHLELLGYMVFNFNHRDGKIPYVMDELPEQKLSRKRDREELPEENIVNKDQKVVDDAEERYDSSHYFPEQDVDPLYTSRPPSTLVGSTFFASPSVPPVASSIEPNHLHAFIAALKNISKGMIINKTENDMAFMASLLRVIANYFKNTKHVHKIHSFQLFVGLYNWSLTIHASKAASKELNDFFKQHPRYKGIWAPQGKNETAKEDLFILSLERISAQLEGMLAAEEEKIPLIFNELVVYMKESINKHKIAGSKSSQIADNLIQRYEDELSFEAQHTFKTR